MFEGIVAYLLNKHLGKYVKDLNSENLNVGIFSGTVQLTDLQLKPEALFELDLPIEVTAGSIGKITIDIPWTSLKSEPVLIHCEDIFILAQSINEHAYDPELERLLLRAAKQKILSDVKQRPSKSHSDDTDLALNKGFVESLIAAALNNVQVSIQNVHVRFESTTVRTDGRGVAAGLVFKSLTAITTNSKWKGTHVDGESKNIFKLIKLETFYCYWNCSCSAERLVKRDIDNSNWTELMKTSIYNCNVAGDEFDFILKPIAIKLKLILNKTREERVPKLLADCVVQDACVELSQEQYVSIVTVYDSLLRMRANRRFLRLRPNVRLLESPSEWWRYAYYSIRDEFIRPRSWDRIKRHREAYRHYRNLYGRHVQSPNDLELKIDLQKLEDGLDLTSILCAQEEAKSRVAAEQPALIELLAIDEIDSPTPLPWWFLRQDKSKRRDGQSSPSGQRVVLEPRASKDSLWAKFTREERQRLKELINSFDDDVTDSRPDQDKFIAHKINLTLTNLTVSLTDEVEGLGEREVLVMNLSQLLGSLETQPSIGRFKSSLRVETFVAEGLAGGSNIYELIPIITADQSLSSATKANSSANHKTYVFALDFESNPLDVEADFSVSGQIDPIEILYQRFALTELARYLSSVPALLSRERLELGRLAEDAARMSQRGVKLLARPTKRKVFLDFDVKSPILVIPERGAMQLSGRVLLIDLGRLSVKSDPRTLPKIDIENATLAELEENSYERTRITLTDVQVLFSDNGDEWRAAKELAESDLHLVPRIHFHAIFSKNVRPGFDQIAGHRVNMATTGVRLNLSDRRLRLFQDFLLNTPLFGLSEQSGHDAADSYIVPDCRENQRLLDMDKNWVLYEPSVEELRKVRLILNSNAAVASLLPVPDSVDSLAEKCKEIGSNEAICGETNLSNLPNVLTDSIIEVPGFERCVSKSNRIKFVFRFTSGEVLVHLQRSSEKCDKPYLMLRFEDIKVDTSIMTYGLVVKASVKNVLLVDKLHAAHSGGYLELLKLKTESSSDVLMSVSYRQVSPECPEFADNFDSTHEVIAIEIGSPEINFHHESVLSMCRYCDYISSNVPDALARPFIDQVDSFVKKPRTVQLQEDKANDLISGTILMDLSIKLRSLTVSLSESETLIATFSLAKVNCSLIKPESNPIQFKSTLSSISVTDESEDTLYPNIIIKESEKDDLIALNVTGKEKSSNSVVAYDIELTVRPIRMVLIYNFVACIINFLDPFMFGKKEEIKAAEETLAEEICKLAANHDLVRFKVNLIGPSLVIPQKINSNNLVIVSLDSIVVENIFDENADFLKTKQFVGSLVVEINGLSMVRGSFMLAAAARKSSIISIKPPIVDKFNLKAKIEPSKVAVGVDFIKVGLNRTDVCVLVAIVQENFYDCSGDIVVSGHNQEEFSSGDCTEVEEVDAKKSEARPPAEHVMDIEIKGIEVGLVHGLDDAPLCKLVLSRVTMGVNDKVQSRLEFAELLDLRTAAKTIFRSGPHELLFNGASLLDEAFVQFSLQNFKVNLSLSFLFDLSTLLDKATARKVRDLPNSFRTVHDLRSSLARLSSQQAIFGLRRLR